MTPGAELAASRGLRMRPHRPARALAGALIVITSVVAALALYTRLGDRTEVLAVNRTILAGEVITDADLAVVSLASDDELATVAASARSTVVGQYARVRLASGSLLVADSLQARPLVTDGRVLMSVEVPAGQVPVGLREQSRVVLVVTSPSTGGAPVAPVLVDATVTAIPRNLAEVVGGDRGPTDISLSVEVPAEYVSLVGSAQAVSIGVLDSNAVLPATQVGVEPAPTATDPAAATAPGPTLTPVPAPTVAVTDGASG